MVKEIITFNFNLLSKKNVLRILNKQESKNGFLIDSNTNKICRFKDNSPVKYKDIGMVGSGSQVYIKTGDIDSLIDYVDKHIVK